MNEWEPPALTASPLPQAAFLLGAQDGRPTCPQTRSGPTFQSRPPHQLLKDPSPPSACPPAWTSRRCRRLAPRHHPPAPCLSSLPPRASFGSTDLPPSPQLLCPRPPTVSTSPWACRHGPTRSRAGVSSYRISPPTPSSLRVPSGPAPPGSPSTHARNCLTPCEKFSNLQKSQKTVV